VLNGAATRVLRQERGVFYRQKAARYYAILPYTLQNLLMSIPLGLLDVITFSVLVYWITGPSSPLLFSACVRRHCVIALSSVWQG
jgi:hypothetical protein